jgi:hypothetical protein
LDYVYLTEDQINDALDCADNPEHFITSFAWLEEKETRQILPFTMGELPGQSHYFQRRILRWLHGGKHVLVHKSRRVGCSWIVAAYTAWLINFQRGANVLFLSKKEDDAIILLEKVKFILRNLAYHDSKDHMKATSASFMAGEIVIDNKQHLAIGYRNDRGDIAATSDVRSLTTTSESARGQGATLIFYDEMAFLPDDEATWRSGLATVARGGQWVAVSTPNGVGNVYHRLVQEAQRIPESERSYQFIEVHYSEAGITHDQVLAATAGQTADDINQEWELQFLQAGNPVFSHTDLAACYKPADEYPEVEEALSRYSREDGFYYGGLDAAEGRVHKKARLKDQNSITFLTRTGIQAFARHDKKPIADWAGKVLSTASGDRVVTEGKSSKFHKGHPGLLKVEQNGPGNVILTNHVSPMDGQSDIIPSHTDAATKSRLINNLIHMVESHRITITDLATYQAMMVFQRGTTPGKFEAPPGYSDDEVISLALAVDLLIEYGSLTFNWADGDAPKRRSYSQEEMEELDAEQAPLGPGIVPVDNIRWSEFVGSGKELPLPEEPSLIPDMTLLDTLMPDEGEPHRRRRRESMRTPRL